MFEALEKRANGLCVGIVIAVIFLGKVFGASLWGLLPLSFCLASGVYVWAKEVVRSGRELEWSSEQLRGQTVRSFFHSLRDDQSRSSADYLLGHRQPVARISGMDECPS
jgi:hypothetical protein